ncbi:MAG: helix-turn-helix transcriptional regulator [Clostridia bacterium]|nr:helix-turn-helix transcriptional regulator [Clostridia bacterium]
MFAQRLKLLRRQRGVTQEELARIIGVDRSSIGKYEGKERIYPSNDVMNAIADYFNVTVDYLLGRTDDPGSRDDRYDNDKITILARGARKLSDEDQKKLIEVAKVLFGKVFDEVE